MTIALPGASGRTGRLVLEHYVLVRPRRLLGGPARGKLRPSTQRGPGTKSQKCDPGCLLAGGGDERSLYAGGELRQQLKGCAGGMA
jgi:hypothetical protein